MAKREMLAVVLVAVLLAAAPPAVHAAGAGFRETNSPKGVFNIPPAAECLEIDRSQELGEDLAKRRLAVRSATFSTRLFDRPDAPAALEPAVYWWMGGTTLLAPEAPQLDHMYWVYERPYNVEVSVNLDFHYRNDDGSIQEHIGSTSEGSTTQSVQYAYRMQVENELYDKVGYAAAGLAGQEVGYQVANRAANAAQNAAAAANPLNPSHQYGNWISNAASSGRNFLGRLVGAAGGII